MSTCTANLKHSLTICKIIIFKVEKKKNSLIPVVDSRVLEAQKTTFLSWFGMSLFKLLFLSELGTCSQNFMPTRSMEPWKNINFYKGVCWNSHTRPVLENKKCIWENLGLIIRPVVICFDIIPKFRDFFFQINQNLKFWCCFKVAKGTWISFIRGQWVWVDKMMDDGSHVDIPILTTILKGVETQQPCFG
jgi:hypothetical protein